MYQEASQALLIDKSLKKHRHVKIWWYVVVGLFLGIFAAQIYREVTRHAKQEVATLDTIFKDEHRVGEDELEKEAAVGTLRGGVKYDYVQNMKPEEPKREEQVGEKDEGTLRGGVKYDYVQNMKPAESKTEEQVGEKEEGMKVPNVGGIKYGYVPNDGPIPRPKKKKKDIPGIKYRYIPNEDNEEKSVQEAQPTQSDSGTFQMMASDQNTQSKENIVSKENVPEQGQTIQMFAKPQEMKPKQDPVGGRSASKDENIFQSLEDDVEKTNKEYGMKQPEQNLIMPEGPSVQVSAQDKAEQEKELNAEINDDSPLPDDEAYAIPADHLTHDDFNIVPEELAEVQAASPMKPVATNVIPRRIPQKNQRNWQQEEVRAQIPSYNHEEKLSQPNRRSYMVNEDFQEANQVSSRGAQKSDWRTELLNDDFSDFHL